MTASGSMTLGTVKNKGNDAVARMSGPVAASTTIAAGNLVYQDGSNCWKPAPTTGLVYASRIWFAEIAADNSSGSKGDKNVTKRRAQELFPGARVTHAVADALLLAEYCRRLEVRI